MNKFIIPVRAPWVIDEEKVRLQLLPLFHLGTAITDASCIGTPFAKSSL